MFQLLSTSLWKFLLCEAFSSLQSMPKTRSFNAFLTQLHVPLFFSIDPLKIGIWFHIYMRQIFPIILTVLWTRVTKEPCSFECSKAQKMLILSLSLGFSLFLWLSLFMHLCLSTFFYVSLCSFCLSLSPSLSFSRLLSLLH